MARKVQKISIALPKEMVDHIRAAVDSGRYASASEVVREAVREWDGPKRHNFPPGYPYVDNVEDLRRMIQKGVDSADRGKVKPAEEVFDRLDAKYRAMADKPERAKRKR
jgi:antitoxin ParD1/3/4